MWNHVKPGAAVVSRACALREVDLEVRQAYGTREVLVCAGPARSFGPRSRIARACCGHHRMTSAADCASSALTRASSAAIRRSSAVIRAASTVAGVSSAVIRTLSARIRASSTGIGAALISIDESARTKKSGARPLDAAVKGAKRRRIPFGVAAKPKNAAARPKKSPARPFDAAARLVGAAARNHQICAGSRGAAASCSKWRVPTAAGTAAFAIALPSASVLQLFAHSHLDCASIALASIATDGSGLNVQQTQLFRRRGKALTQPAPA